MSSELGLFCLWVVASTSLFFSLMAYFDNHILSEDFVKRVEEVTRLLKKQREEWKREREAREKIND